MARARAREEGQLFSTTLSAHLHCLPLNERDHLQSGAIKARQRAGQLGATARHFIPGSVAVAGLLARGAAETQLE